MAYYYGDGNYQNNQNNQNRKPDNDWFSWGLIAILFITGLWPIGLILLISKLSDGSGRKKTISSSTYARQEAARKAAEAKQAAQAAREAAAQAQKQAAQAQKSAQEMPKSKAGNVMASVTRTPQYGEKGSKAMQIVGAVLGIIGAIALIDGIGDAISFGTFSWVLRDIFCSTGLLAGGIGLLLGGWGMKRRARRFAKYLKAAGKKEAVDINRLAEAAEVSEPKAEKDVEIMVEKGLWGPEAYVDNTNDMLFRTQAAAAEYFQKKAAPKAPFAAAPPQAEEGFSGMLRNIRRANDRISDPELSAKIARLEEITARIFKTIEEHPSRREKANTFLNYYLPTTQKLLDSYADFEEAGVSGTNLSQAKARIEKTMDNIVAGFEHQLDELYQAEAMDVDSDIRVMESMLRRDTGTVEDDFGLSGGTAVQEWDGE